MLSQPIIDITTGFQARYMNGFLTPGALIRTLLLVFVLPYIWNQLRSQRWFMFVLVAALTTIVLTSGLSFMTKDPFYAKQEAVFYMKVAYFVVAVIFMFIYVQKPLLPHRQTARAIIASSYMIGGSYAIALATKTGFPSYPHGEIGFSGWFFSANELSVIPILLFASALTIARQHQTASAYGTLFLLAGMGMLIGTKTAYLGLAALLLVHVIDLIITHRREIFLKKHVWITVVLCLLFFGALPFIPMTANSIQNHTSLTDTTRPLMEQRLNDHTSPASNLLSSRQHYLHDTMLDFKHAPLIRKLFGLGYAGDYSRDAKMIEMDFIELFFSFGYIGTIFLLTPFALLISWILLKGSFHRKQWALLTGFALTIGIAAVAGHVLFAPSVMSYVIMSAALLEQRKKTRRMEKNRSGKDDTCRKVHVTH